MWYQFLMIYLKIHFEYFLFCFIHIIILGDKNQKLLCRIFGSLYGIFKLSRDKGTRL